MSALWTKCYLIWLIESIIADVAIPTKGKWMHRRAMKGQCKMCLETVDGVCREEWEITRKEKFDTECRELWKLGWGIIE